MSYDDHANDDYCGYEERPIFISNKAILFATEGSGYEGMQARDLDGNSLLYTEVDLPLLRSYFAQLVNQCWYDDDHVRWHMDSARADRHRTGLRQLRDMRSLVDPDNTLWNLFAPTGYL